ncbi:hypothetical protein [Rhizobium sp.]
MLLITGRHWLRILIAEISVLSKACLGALIMGGNWAQGLKIIIIKHSIF